MKIILSPTKQMRSFPGRSPSALPALLDRTETLLSALRSMTPLELQELWACSDKLVLENLARLEEIDLYQALTPSLFAYEGIAFKYLAPETLSPAAQAYLQQHLRILSGFYGILRPEDGVSPYRLEMQARLRTEFCSSLYDFWGADLRKQLSPEPETIINLASKEYSVCIEKHLLPGDRFITCIFGQLVKGKLVQKGVYAKMARGSMVRFLAENAVSSPEGLRAFDALGFAYDPSRSDERSYVFLSDTVG